MRTPREHSQYDIYHVVSRGVGRQLIFEDDDDRDTFLELLKKAINTNGVEVYAWCLMDNHIHLLLHAELEHVSQCMKQLCGAYAQYFNHKAGRVGHLFQERFKSEPVNDEAYLLTVTRYIHDNPSKAQVSTMEDYRWSSYREYVTQPKLCSTAFVLGVFGGLEAFIEFHADESRSARCLDVSFGRNKTRAMPDSTAIDIAKAVLGMELLENLKALPLEERNEGIRRLRMEGLTVRQIERLTGIGRNIVQRVSLNEP